MNLDRAKQIADVFYKISPFTAAELTRLLNAEMEREVYSARSIGHTLASSPWARKEPSTISSLGQWSIINKDDFALWIKISCAVR